MAEFFNNFLAPSSAVYTEWAIIGAVLVFSLLATRKIKEVPGVFQNMGEMAVGKLLGFFSGIMGEKNARRYFPVLGTFFIFIIVSNYTGELPGSGMLFTVPTSTLAAPMALGIISFITIHACGVKKKGVPAYLKSFTKPVIILLPITILEQFVRPLSLTLRLYGNIYGEDMVLENLRDIFPLFLPWLMNILGLMFALIQAMVFTMLLAIFIGEAVEEE